MGSHAILRQMSFRACLLHLWLCLARKTKRTKKCENCRNLQFPAIGELPCPWESAVKASADRGCRYCNFLVKAVAYFVFEDDVEGDRAFFLGKIQGTEGHYNVQPGSLFLFENVQQSCVIQLYTPAGLPPAWPGIPQDVSRFDPRLLGSPQTPEAYEFIRSCLRNCDANHPHCKASSQELPTRLLDVQHEGGRQVRLIESASLPVGHAATYVALSYCWGRGKTLKLMTENLDAMKMGLSVSSLPQTLQDAVTVTRALDQKYLWIDALCIIQNSLADWEVESSRMASVYRNAYVTIAAATAADVSEGFLSRHYPTTNTWYKEPYHAEWVNHESQPTVLGARLQLQDRPPGHYHHDGRPVQGNPLPWATRGWTLQEELLSRRVIKYHLYEVRWICQSHRLCQCGKDSDEAGLNEPIHSNTSRSTIPNTLAADEFKEWASTVEVFTRRVLTVPLDALPALSGLANVSQQRTQSQYIAGLWKENLIFDILWKRSDEAGPCTYAPADYTAPSFSWASIASEVTFLPEVLSEGLIWQSVIEDSSSTPAGKDPLGRVKDGWLQVRGYMPTATLHAPEQQDDGSLWYDVEFENCSFEEAITFQLQHDTLIGEFDATDEHGNVERSVRRLRAPSTIPTPNLEHSQPKAVSDTPIYLLFVAYRTQWNGSLGEFLFLALGMSADKPGRYERIGFASYEVDFRVVGTDRDGFLAFIHSRAGEQKTITIV